MADGDAPPLDDLKGKLLHREKATAVLEEVADAEAEVFKRVAEFAVGKVRPTQGCIDEAMIAELPTGKHARAKGQDEKKKIDGTEQMIRD